jgi:enoyl-CoA hydratase
MVRVEWRERVVVVTLDRPERRNAVDHATLLELRAAQNEAVAGGARVVVLTGAPPAFCAGADLTGVESGEFLGALTEVLLGFTSMPIVTIAAISGAALGAGTQLAVACDLRVATATSQFGVPAAKLGLAVDRFTVNRLAQEFGASVARSMLLTAETYSAERLHLSGGVHRLGELDDALGWADEIASLAPLTIAAHKLALEGLGEPLGALDSLSSIEVFSAIEMARRAAWASVDAEEGRSAFLAKRRPEFTGH